MKGQLGGPEGQRDSPDGADFSHGLEQGTARPGSQSGVVEGSGEMWGETGARKEARWTGLVTAQLEAGPRRTWTPAGSRAKQDRPCRNVGESLLQP